MVSTAPASATLQLPIRLISSCSRFYRERRRVLASCGLQHSTSTLETVASGWSAGTRYLRKDGTRRLGRYRICTGRSGTHGTRRVPSMAEVDTTAPSLSTATVDGTSLVLTYNEALDAGSEPATSAYSVSVNSGTGVAPSSVDVTGIESHLDAGNGGDCSPNRDCGLHGSVIESRAGHLRK